MNNFISFSEPEFVSPTITKEAEIMRSCFRSVTQDNKILSERDITNIAECMIYNKGVMSVISKDGF